MQMYKQENTSAKVCRSAPQKQLMVRFECSKPSKSIKVQSHNVIYSVNTISMPTSKF